MGWPEGRPGNKKPEAIAQVCPLFWWRKGAYRAHSPKGHGRTFWKPPSEPPSSNPSEKLFSLWKPLQDTFYLASRNLSENLLQSPSKNPLLRSLLRSESCHRRAPSSRRKSRKKDWGVSVMGSRQSQPLIGLVWVLDLEVSEVRRVLVKASRWFEQEGSKGCGRTRTSRLVAWGASCS